MTTSIREADSLPPAERSIAPTALIVQLPHPRFNRPIKVTHGRAPLEQPVEVDPYTLIRLAEIEWKDNRIEQAEKLIEFAYSCFDQAN